MLDCWNANNYDDKKCAEQIQKFIECGNVAVEAYHASGRVKQGTVPTNKIREVLTAYTLVGGGERKQGERKQWENVPYNKSGRK